MDAGSTRRDGGQAAVELALCLPFVCLLVLGLVQVAIIVRDRIAVVAQLTTRSATTAAPSMTSAYSVVA